MNRRILFVEDSATYAEWLRIHLERTCQEFEIELLHVETVAQGSRTLGRVDGVILDAMLEDSRAAGTWKDTAELWSQFLPLIVHSSRDDIRHDSLKIIPKYDNVDAILGQFREWFSSIYGEP